MGQHRVTITWVGHATVLIDVDGYRILTDPSLTPRLAHLRRRVPTTNIGPVDAILISHVHMDHLHSPSLRLVSTGARVIVPAGGERLVRRIGAASIEAVTPGSRITISSDNAKSPVVKVQVLHAEHKDTRGPHSSVRAKPVGYVVEIGERRIYFAGDTDLFDGMHHLGPIDVSLLPIWGWGSTLGERHLNPERAATATSWMQPRFVVPIHWGTYSPIRPQSGSPPWLKNPIELFRQELSAVNMNQRLMALDPGGSIELE